MFVSQAHSFRQQARLAVTLAWIGGYTDIITLLSCGAVTSHMSGTTAAFGRDLFTGSWSLLRLGCFVLATFFFGAAISGVCTNIARRRKWESIYVLSILVELLLLGAFAVCLAIRWNPMVESRLFLYRMIGLASTAMGLQNATISRISGGQVRTTHVTGVLTDLGHEGVEYIAWLLGRRRQARGQNARSSGHDSHPSGGRLVMLASIMVSFATGAGLAGLAYSHAPRWAMLPPVAFLIWIVYRDLSQPIAGIEASNWPTIFAELAIPDSLAIFHLRKAPDRKGRSRRMPNLLEWSATLPSSARVVLLDLEDGSELDSNSAMELRAVIAKLAEQGRSLILAGVEREHFDQMSVVGDVPLEPENVCSDLELAIARGLALVG